MPQAKNADIDICYEVEGKGPPLILVDRVTTDLSVWREYGYVDALRDNYQLILIDPRGMAKSWTSS